MDNWETIDGNNPDGEEGQGRPLSLSQSFEVLENFSPKDWSESSVDPGGEAVLCGSFETLPGDLDGVSAGAEKETIQGSLSEFEAFEFALESKDRPLFDGSLWEEKKEEEDLDDFGSKEDARSFVVVNENTDDPSRGTRREMVRSSVRAESVVLSETWDPLSAFVREQEADEKRSEDRPKTPSQRVETALTPKLFQREETQTRLRKNRQTGVSDVADIPKEIFKSRATSKRRIFKVIIVGDTNVGKTCLALRFCVGSFPEKVEATIGVDFREKSIQIADDTIKLQLWDTAGQERFRKSMVPYYYRNANAIVFVYDVTKQSSFDSLTGWIQECDEYDLSKEIPRILIGNKCDLYDRIVIRTSHAQQFADLHQMPLFETSAKTNGDCDNVDSIFLTLAYKLKCCRPWMQVPRDCGYMPIRRSTVFLSVDATTRQGSDGGFCGCFK